MFFRRKKSTEAPREEDAGNQRDQSRGSIPDRALLSARLVTWKGEEVEGEVADLTIQGAGVRLNFAESPEITIGDVVEMTVECRSDDWRVTTPARLARSAQDGNLHVLHGFEFINLGNLYAQLENALTRYFNRRRVTRVQPDPDDQPGAMLTYKGHKMHGSIHDMSQYGLGVTIRHVQAIVLHPDAAVRYRFQVPGDDAVFEGWATVRQGYRMGELDLVGIEFDLDRSPSLQENMDILDEYLGGRIKVMERWEASWADWIDPSL